ncbi:MAG: hypothetical protein U0L84_06215, partial [Acutalibacteraceae bacterium]|nr:hypothetical protein [Acutalibacteraceae bacterium]
IMVSAVPTDIYPCAKRTPPLSIFHLVKVKPAFLRPLEVTGSFYIGASPPKARQGQKGVCTALLVLTIFIPIQQHPEEARGVVVFLFGF